MALGQCTESSSHDVRVVQFVLGRVLRHLRAALLDGNFYRLSNFVDKADRRLKRHLTADDADYADQEKLRLDLYLRYPRHLRLIAVSVLYPS